MVVSANELRTSSFLPYLQNQDPYGAGLVIRPEDLPEEVARIARSEQSFRDGIDSEQELRRLMQMLDQSGGDLNGLPRPNFQNLGGIGSQDMLAMLVDWIQSGGPEANKRINRPRPIGNLSSPSGYSATPTNWSGSGGSGGVHSTGGGGGGHVHGSGGGTASPAAGGAGGASGQTYPPDQVAKDLKNLKKEELTAAEKADVAWDRLNPEAREAAMVAKGMGLTVTSGAEGHSGDGVHTPSSNHYSGSAIDVSGSPEAMSRFYQTMKQLNPQAKELFYDPHGGIKNGQEIGAIGGHGDHVHYAP